MSEGFLGKQTPAVRQALKLEQQLRRLGKVPEEASDKAEMLYPGQSWNHSPKNDFRHALTIGRLTQELGNHWPAQAIAKMAGYVWEGRDGLDYLTNADHRKDTHEDISANALGARLARESSTPDELTQRLQQYLASR